MEFSLNKNTSHIQHNRAPQVVPANVEDAPALTKLIRRSIAERAYHSYPPDASKLQGWLGLIDESAIRAALQLGSLYDIGVIRDPHHTPIAMGTFDIKGARGVQLYVCPNCSGQGLGSAIARWLDTVALSHGVSSFLGEATLGALAFWIKNGHVPTGRTRLFLDYFPVIEIRRDVPASNNLHKHRLPTLD